MAEFFKPVITEIIRLVESQVTVGKKNGYGNLSVRWTILSASSPCSTSSCDRAWIVA